MKFLVSSLLVLLVLVGQLSANEVLFGSGDTVFSIELVEVGSPGNRPDVDERIVWPTTDEGSGAVDYVYEIAKYETSCEIANLARDAGAFAEIGIRSGPGNRFCTSFPSQGLPVGVDLTRAWAFANWLNAEEGFEAAYDLENLNPMVRNPNAKYFVSSGDEWYKAAFYDPEKDLYYDYATGSNKVPTYTSGGTEQGTAVIFEGSENHTFVDVHLAGGKSPFGTVGQTGNGSELEDLSSFYFSGVEDLRFTSWQIRKRDQTAVHAFRIVAIQPVPEPSYGVLSFAFSAMLSLRRRRR